jgi:hypothetical protein
MIKYGGSIFSIAVGAILYFAVTGDQVKGIDFQTVGLILMVLGLVGLVLSFISFAVTRQKPVQQPAQYVQGSAPQQQPPQIPPVQ